MDEIGTTRDQLEQELADLTSKHSYEAIDLDRARTVLEGLQDWYNANEGKVPDRLNKTFEEMFPVFQDTPALDDSTNPISVGPAEQDFDPFAQSGDASPHNDQTFGKDDDDVPLDFSLSAALGGQIFDPSALPADDLFQLPEDPPPPSPFALAQPAEITSGDGAVPVDAEALVGTDDEEFQFDFEGSAEERQDVATSDDEEEASETVTTSPAQDDQAPEPQVGQLAAEEEAAPEAVVADEPAEALVDDDLAELAEDEVEEVEEVEEVPDKDLETVTAPDSEEEEVLVLDEADEALTAARIEIAVLTERLSKAQADVDVFRDLAQKGATNLAKLPTKEEMLAHFAALKNQISSLSGNGDLNEKLTTILTELDALRRDKGLGEQLVAILEAVTALSQETELREQLDTANQKNVDLEKKVTHTEGRMLELEQAKQTAITEARKTRNLLTEAEVQLASTRREPLAVVRERISENSEEAEASQPEQEIGDMEQPTLHEKRIAARQTKLIARKAKLEVRKENSPALLGWWTLVPPLFIFFAPIRPKLGWVQGGVINLVRWPLATVINLMVWAVLLYGVTSAVHNYLPTDNIVRTHVTAPVLAEINPSDSNDGTETRVQELQLEKSELTETLASKVIDNDRLERQLAELTTEYNEATTERDGLQEQLTTTQGQLNQLGPVLAEARAARNTAQEEVRQLTASLATLTTARDGLQTSLETAQEQTTQLGRDLADARTARDTAQEWARDLETAIAAVTGEKNRLQASLTAAQRRNTALQSSLARVTTELDQVRNEISDVPVLLLGNDGKLSLPDDLAPASTTHWQIGRTVEPVADPMEGVAAGFVIVNFYNGRAYLSNKIVRVTPISEEE